MSNNQISKRVSLSEESVRERTELFYKYIIPHINLVYSICIQYTFNRADVEDNYSDALANFYKYIKSYNPEKSLKSWIYAVTQRFIWEQNKRNKKIFSDKYTNMHSIRDKEDGSSNVSFTCVDQHNYQEFYNDNILSALDQLNPIHKEALLLQQAGYRVDEIMEIAFQNGSLKSRNLETVKSRIFFAKRQISKLITPDGESRED